MQHSKYIYNVNYQVHEDDLCELEMKSLFNVELKNKVFLSDIEMNPSISPFIRNRLKIIYKTSSFAEIISLIETDGIKSEDFMVKYFELSTGDENFKKRREICKEIGLRINGFPCYTRPKTTFGISNYEGGWYFGVLVSNDSKWREHNNKPYSYSSSLGMNMAKALMNIAGNGNFSKRIIDPCCGVGTVLLEGLFAGYDISGWEIMSKVAENARRNLSHFNYPTKVTTGDIKDIDENYDVSVIDLPYGICSRTNVDTQSMIIKNAKRISKKIVLVSSSDISDIIIEEELNVIEHCKISKSKNHNFIRHIWVCN